MYRKKKASTAKAPTATKAPQQKGPYKKSPPSAIPGCTTMSIALEMKALSAPLTALQAGKALLLVQEFQRRAGTLPAERLVTLEGMVVVHVDSDTGYPGKVCMGADELKVTFPGLVGRGQKECVAVEWANPNHTHPSVTLVHQRTLESLFGGSFQVAGDKRSLRIRKFMLPPSVHIDDACESAWRQFVTLDLSRFDVDNVALMHMMQAVLLAYAKHNLVPSACKVRARERVLVWFY